MNRDLYNIIYPIRDDIEMFNNQFDISLKSKVPIINQIIRYIVKNKGKQLRPILCLLSARICGKSASDTYISASLIEMLHIATLIHDDVVDESKIRHGWPTINKIWKNKLSVLIGDYIFSKALSNMVRINNKEALKVLSETAEKLSQGEILQIERAIKKEMSEEVYYKMIKDKTASLFSASCTIGAMSTTTSHSKIDNMMKFGEFLGMAFQIKDDLFDILGNIDMMGKPIGFDVKKNMLTLPYIYMYKKLNSKSSRVIKRKLRNHARKSEISLIRNIVQEHGGVKYAQNKMQELSNNAIDQLKIFPDSNIKESLISLVYYNMNRTH